MKKLLKTISIISFLIIFGCNSNHTNEETRSQVVKQLTEEELKEQLREKECNNPNNYLTGQIKTTLKYKNAFSMKVKGMALKFIIQNKATMAKYKDVKCRVRFISKTGSTIMEKEFVIYEFFGPKRTIQYETEIQLSNQQYKNIANYNWTILDASCN